MCITPRWAFWYMQVQWDAIAHGSKKKKKTKKTRSLQSNICNPHSLEEKEKKKTHDLRLVRQIKKKLSA